MTSLNLPTYEHYKESGVEWLGRVPAHWGMEKGKWLFEKKDRPVRTEDGVVTAFRDGQVTLRSNRRTEGFTNAIKEHGYQGIRKGDLVIHAMDAFAGAIGVSDSDGKSTPVYAACVPRNAEKVNPSYYAYLLRYMAHSGFILTLAKGIRERSTDFRYNDFGALTFPIPPKPEQDRIVAFLDEKTAMIDELIAKKKRQIELLEEQKTILINRAVTRGLNPNAKLKPSGIEWIGEIPEGWETGRLKHQCTHIVDCLHATPSYDEEGEFPAIRTADITPGHTNYQQAKKINANDFKKWTERLQPKPGDVLYSREGERFGIAAPVPVGSNLCISQRMMVFRPKPTINSQFLVWQLNCIHVILQASQDVFGSTSPHVNISTISNFRLFTPPYEEQIKIANWIDRIDATAEYIFNRIMNEISSLHDLRKALIAQAITGKTKVA